MENLTLYYGFIVVTILTLTGFINATSVPQIVSAVLVFPLALFFWLRVFPKRRKALVLGNLVKPEKHLNTTQSSLSPSKLKDVGPYLDKDRRMFLKIIGSAGLTLFFFSIFTKKAHAAFFGSIPGPGTVSLKDSTGTVIDPALKQPTDGYNISQVDDSAPAYYGFVDKSGNWYIMKEDDTTGNFRYSKGTSGFSTNWTNRASLTYDYFNIVF